MSKLISSAHLSVLSRLKVNQNGILYAVWGTFLIFLTSQISIPLKPVPITLQTFGVMLIGLTFSRQAAIKAMTGYLVLGAIGLPVFANFSGGIQCLLGPTGGYLIGFLVCVAVMTTLRSMLHNQKLLYIMINCLIGTGIILVCGLFRLSCLIGFKAAINGGLLPFILPGICKALLLACTVRYLNLGNRT